MSNPRLRETRCSEARGCNRRRSLAVGPKSQEQDQPSLYFASWKMTPSVCRRPVRTALTPWRRLTRYTPFVPRTGR